LVILCEVECQGVDIRVNLQSVIHLFKGAGNATGCFGISTGIFSSATGIQLSDAYDLVEGEERITSTLLNVAQLAFGIHKPLKVSPEFLAALWHMGVWLHEKSWCASCQL
jgi:hypothetical protein